MKSDSRFHLITTLALLLAGCGGAGLPPAALEPPAAQAPAPGDILATIGSPSGSHGAGVLCVAIDSAGTVIASGGADGTARLWDAGTLRPLARLAIGEPTTRINAVAFNGDGNTLATAQNSGSIRLWDVSVSPPKPVAELKQIRFGADSLSLSGDGKWLAAGGIDAGPHVFDLRVSPPQLVPNLPRITGTAHSMLFSPDSRTLAVDSGFEIQLWDMTVTPPTPRANLGKGGSNFRTGTSLLSFSKDGKTLSAAGNSSETIRLWDLSGEQPVEKSPAKGRSYGAALSPDGALLAVASSGGGRWHARETYLPRVRLFEVGGGETRELDAVEAHLAKDAFRVTTIAFSPDGRTVVSGGEDGAVERWEVSTRKLRPGRGEDGTNIFIEAAAPSPDGRRLAVVGRSDSVFIWNLETQPPSLETKITVPRSGFKPVVGLAYTTNLTLSHVAWSADGKTLATVRARTGWSGG
ncbi:MAG: WD40 repeat domain-containing protein, partial [Proteobacteria bacterium]|nr:WD40 repeat domain-containing protein [Pseudomonadota bacterium]